MKAPLTLIKPAKQRSKSALTSNMFHDPNHIDDVPTTSRDNAEHFDFVGPQQFRKKLISKKVQPLKLQQRNTPANAEPNSFNQTMNSKTPFNTTTINRNTMLQSLHKEQQIQYTKQTRNLERFKDYKNDWEKRNTFLKQNLNKNPVLMEKNIKSLYVHPNEPKNETINQFIVHYWEMSLRNNHPILERHIKGHRFSKVQKQKLLQLRGGIKQIENSIPVLPAEQLQSLKGRDLSLNGKNKVKRQIDQESMFSQTRYSIPNSARIVPQQVLKIDYDGDKKWLGTQNL